MTAQEDVLAKLQAQFQALAAKPKELKAQLEQWAIQQPAWVEGLVLGAQGSVQGAFLGAVMGLMTKMSAETAAGAGGMAVPASMMQAGPLMQARNFAVMTGVNSGLAAYVKRIRGGKEDVKNNMIAAFGSGFCFSLISGMSGGGAANAAAAAASSTPANPLMGAFSAGVVFALFQGGFYKLGEKFGSPKVEDENKYAKVAAMLSNLGMKQYEKNIKKGLLDDSTIALWDSATLAEVRIPPGPRLLILDHIDTYRHLLRPAMPLGGEPYGK